MIPGIGPVWQALIGSCFTWAVTAMGSSCVFFFKSSSCQLLGFSAGVMIAASFWSLLEPAIVVGRELYGNAGFCLVCIGFLFGAVFVFLCDALFDQHSVVHFLNNTSCIPKRAEEANVVLANSNDTSSDVRRRKRGAGKKNVEEDVVSRPERVCKRETSWRRILMLVVAITVHNIPEGIAVGVGFAATNRTAGYSFDKARSLAIGIGLQNFPEGLAVSLPLAAFGYSRWSSFFFGQLSGMVEPLAAVVGAYSVAFMRSALPLTLGFAAGAMIFVVFDDVMPEAQSRGNRETAVWCLIIGFTIMMSMDTLL